MAYPPIVDRIAESLHSPTGVVATLLLLFAAMVVGSAIRLATIEAKSTQGRSRLGSLATWWTLALLFGGALLIGPLATAGFFALAAFLGIREFLSLTLETRRDRVGDLLACVAVPTQYFVAILGGTIWPWTFLPLLFFLVLPLRMMLTGATTGYIHDIGTVFWGTILLGFSLSHVMMLAAIPPSPAFGDWAGWILFLVLLTESNDIAQALWGRQFGRHKVTPTISPNKTWEGLIFGIVTTMAIGLVLSRLLTPLTWFQSVVAGGLIAIGGFCGDINMSAVKRDIGVKDSSSLLPGQGGVLDRIDSLSFSAPLFYYYVRWLGGE